MIRTVWVAVVSLVATLVCSPLVVLVAVFSSHSPLIDRIVRYWARSIVLAAGISLTVEGEEGIDWGRRYVLIANHHSYMDIPVLLCAVPQPVRFMAKKSLFQIPIFGWGLKAGGFIPIDRKNRGTAAQSFGLAGERIRKGNTIVVFPEGGRSRTFAMQEFKKGAFLLALKSRLPILPAAIVGTFEVLPSTRLKVVPGPVVVRLSRPVAPDEFSVRQISDLVIHTREAIDAMRSEDASS